ncbi:MAG: hypothetical protein WC415_03355 [Patescibacteria group bacterium]|jgi:hypothetical protein
MNILDTSALINYIEKSNALPKAVYFITSDIENEIFTTEIDFNTEINDNIRVISENSFFNESRYLNNYYYILNKHSGRSFYNMTGFGDISIMALIKTLIEAEKDCFQQQLPLKELKENLVVYVDDIGLKKRIVKEFKQDIETRVNVLLSNEMK